MTILLTEEKPAGIAKEVRQMLLTGRASAHQLAGMIEAFTSHLFFTFQHITFKDYKIKMVRDNESLVSCKNVP